MFSVGSGSTRFVDMEMTPAKRFSNFYLMEGPLPGDQGSRITVLHSGQERQCSHCLRTLAEGCLGQGQGKICKELGSSMTRMSDYMLELKNKIGYESLKSQYMQKYPALGPNVRSNFTSPSDQQMENDDSTQSSDEVDSLNEKIDILEKEATETKKNLEQCLHQAKRSGDLAKNKISITTECLDMFLIDNLKNKKMDEFDPSFKFLVS